MFERKTSPVDSEPTPPPPVMAIIAKNQVVEVWHIECEQTSYKERDLHMPKEVRTREVNGRRERYEVHRRQLARQEWGHFIIRRYQATRMLPWAPVIGLAMLIPGTLLAAGSANQGIIRTPLSVLVFQTGLIVVGGLLALVSGWRVIATRLRFSDGVPLESFGVSGHSLGYRNGLVASKSVPVGYRRGRFRGLLDVHAPVGKWEVVKDYADETSSRPTC
jgi:hypothetical protein